MIRFISVLLFALTLGTAQAQTTVGWLTNATGLASLPPTSSRQAVSVGNESSGWSQWNWNAASTASTNSTTVAYTGLATGRWIQSPITGTASGLLTTANATAALGIANKQMVDAIGTIVTNNAAAKLDVTNGVAVGLTTATAPTTGNSVANKTYVDATSSGVAGNTPVQTTSIATLRSFSPTYSLVNGQQFTVGGYYSNGDGGGGDFRYDSTDTTSADNGGTIIVAASGARLKRIITGPVNIKAWGAIGDASTDNAAVFRKAVTNTPNLFVPAGTFNVSGEIAIPSTLVITGESSRTAVINASTTNFVFVYQSPLDGFDEDSGLRISDLYFNAKNALKFGNGTNSFPSQRALLHGVIKDCYFIGTFSGDTNANTAVVPTESELLEQGVAVYGAKLFDFTFSNLHVTGYGIGFALYGCDINNITDTRAVQNSRHFHLIRYSSFGSQNKIQNCDLLQNLRIGAIYDENWITSIKDNYFETYTDAAQFVRARQTLGTLFWGNRIDCTSSTTPMMSLAPLYDYVVSNNRYIPNTPASTIEVLPTYWTVLSQELVTFTGNASRFPETRWPQCRYDEYSSETLWDAWSPKQVGGVKGATYPWSTNSVTGLPSVQGGSDSLYVYFTPNMNWSTMAIKFSGVSIGGAQGYAVVTWGGTEVLRGFIGLTTTNALQTVSFPITRPVGIDPTAQILIEVVNSQTAYHSIELVGAGSDKVGTVTSVAASVPAFLSVSGSPVTTNGTLAIAYSGTALPVANGGTGATTSTGTGSVVLANSPTIATGLTIGNGTGSPTLYLNGAAGGNRGIEMDTAGVARWKISVLGSESGSDVGSYLQFESFTDAGVSKKLPFAITRDGGLVAMGVTAPSAGTYFPAWTSSPETGRANLYSRTAAQVRSDIGAGTGSGTVTSVAASVPAFLSISGSPITVSGTLAISYSGTALPVANGGTGATTSTGTGSVVLADNPTLTTPTLGVAGASKILATYFSSQYRAKHSSDGTGASLLAAAGGLFIGANAYYNDVGAWTLDAPSGNTNSQLLFLTPGAGVKWYASASTNASAFNIANALTLWNNVGTWTQPVATAGAVSGSTLTSTIATGTAPLTVASTTLVSNLNADRLDGLHKGGIQPANANLTNVAALTVQSLPSIIISVTENTQTGTTYTVLSTDNGKVVTLNNAAAITVTVPTLSAGFSCTFIQKGAGQVTFSASGTTVSNAHSQTKTFGQYAAVTLYGLSSTTFVLAGDTGT